MRCKLTPRRVRELLDFDGERFFWRMKRGCRSAGAVAGHLGQRGYHPVRGSMTNGYLVGILTVTSLDV
jgi:hypothetical protein